MVKVDAAYSLNFFGQLVFAGCESMPEPPVPKRRGRKKSANISCSRSDRESIVRVGCRGAVGSGGSSAHILGD